MSGWMDRLMVKMRQLEVRNAADESAQRLKEVNDLNERARLRLQTIKQTLELRQRFDSDGAEGG